MEPTLEERLHPARHLFSVIGLAVFSIIIVGVFIGTAYIARTALQSGQMAAIIAATLVDLANKDRAEEDLAQLTVDPLLTAAAQAKANDMAKHGYFAHTSPDGIDPWFWIHEAGYNFSAAGENLAIDFSDSADVERAWMNSPGHRANILSGKFTQIGIATAVGEYKGKKTTFIVQMFGAPRAKVAVTPKQPSAPVTSTAPTAAPEEPVVVTVDEEPVAPTTGLAENLPEPSVAAAQVVESASLPAPRYANEATLLVASPANLLRGLYIACAVIILLALLLATRMEFKRHHLRHVAAASFLLVLMGGLFTFADWYLFSDPVVGQEIATAS